MNNSPQESFDSGDCKSIGNADPTLIATAFHEAGHAVAATSLGRKITKVTIKTGRSSNGKMRLGVCELGNGRRKPSKHELEDDVLILFAGMVAESQFTGRYCPEGAGLDLRMISRLLEQLTKNQKQFERLHRRLFDKTEHLLSEEGHATAIKLVAQELIARESISGRAVIHFFDQATKE